jgi:hypothetical protein
MGGWTLWTVNIYICTKAINALWVDSWPRPKSNGRGENHLGRRVPSSQTSLYRSLWGECHVHRPLFTGRPSGLGVQGKCQVYRSLFTDLPLQVPSLPISLYRSLPMGRWQKKRQKDRKTERQKDRKTQRQKDRKTERHKMGQIFNIKLISTRLAVKSAD